MLRRTLHGTIHLFGALGAALAIAVVALAWRLSAGPISLAFLTSHAENALNTLHPEIRFQFGDTVLTWGGWDRTVDLRVQSVRVFEKSGGVIANIPEASFSLSAQALLRGTLAPRGIDLFGPRLFLARKGDGSIEVALSEMGGESQDLLQRLLRQLLEPPNAGAVMGYLARLNIIGADLSLVDVDRQRSWSAPAADIRIVRDAEGLHGTASLDLAADGGQSRVDIRGVYRAASGLTDATMTFGRARPAAFAEFVQAFAPFKALDLPLAGSASLTLDRDGGVQALGFDLTGGAGRLVLPEPAPQTMALAGLALKGRYEGETDRLLVESFRLDLGPDGVFVIPSAGPGVIPGGHAIPLRRIEGRGVYFPGQARAELTDMRLDLGAGRLRLTATAAAEGTDIAVRASGQLENVRADDLAHYWPASWGRDARDWVTANLSDGVLTRARASMEGRLGAATDQGRRFVLDSIKGDMDARDVTVDYLAPMSKARGVSARATFDASRFDITIEKGEAPGLAVTGGTIALTGLDQLDQYADIALAISGNFRDALRLIDGEPLRFASRLGVAAEGSEGAVAADLKLKFMIEHALTAERVEVKAVARLDDIAVRGILLGQDLRQGNLALTLDGKGMDIKGEARVGAMKATIDWRRNFEAKAAFRSRYRLIGRSGELGTLEDLGFDLGPMGQGRIEGTAGVDLLITEGHADERAIEARADLKDLAVEIKQLGWSKARGVEAAAEAAVRLKGAVVTAIPSFAVAAADMTIKGRAVYAADGSGLDRIEVDRVQYGRTDTGLVVRQRDDGGWDMDFKGAGFDFGPLWSEVLKGGAAGAEQEAAANLKLGLVFALDKVWMGADRSFDGVTGAFRHDGKHWRTAEAKGRVGKANKPFAFAIRPNPETGADKDQRVLTLIAEDAGAMLHALDLYDNMVGGVLEIHGAYRDGDVGEPLVGRAVARDYRIVNAPLLARLLSVAALTGILDELKGEGLNFAALDLPFVQTEGLFELREARAFGASLGFTAKGKIYTDADVMDVDGTIVPAYAINSLLGHLPVLGEIFTGGEKGGGVFAASFRMTGAREDPSVSINPLATLAPGFLRNLFGVFGTAGRAAPAPREESR